MYVEMNTQFQQNSPTMIWKYSRSSSDASGVQACGYSTKIEK